MTQTLATPDIADRHRRFLVFALLAIAVVSFIEAARFLVDTGTSEILDVIGLSLRFVAVAFIVPMFVWKLRNRDASMRHLYLRQDGYVAQSLERAKNVSWVATFVALEALAAFADGPNSLPAPFYLEVVTGILLGVFCCVFLFANRSERFDESKELAHA